MSFKDKLNMFRNLTNSNPQAPYKEPQPRKIISINKPTNDVRTNTQQNSSTHSEADYSEEIKDIMFKDKKREFKVIEPDFNQGKLDSVSVQKIINECSKGKDIKKIYAQNIKKNQIMREPVQVASMKEGCKTPIFMFDKLQKVLERAGTRPIIFVSALGKYQQGKSSTIAGFTGNLKHNVGNSSKECTDGVYIDGPYTLQNFYERFNVKPRENISYRKYDNEKMEPVIFFFDIEGFGGQKNRLDINDQLGAYRDLLIPFLAMSSVYFYAADMNTLVDEIKWIVEGLQISSITNNDPSNRGKLGLIISMKNVMYPIISEEADIQKYGEFDPKNSKTYGAFDKYQHDHFINVDQLEDKGMTFSFVPLYPPIDEKTFLRSFNYFAEKMIRAIENASESEFIRDCSSSMELVKLIQKYANSPNFEKNIQEAEYNNTIQRFVLNYGGYDKINGIFEYVSREFDLHKDHIQSLDLNSIKRKYVNMLKVNIGEILGNAQCSDEASRIKKEMINYIYDYIDKKYKEAIDEGNKRQEEIKSVMRDECTKEGTKFINEIKKELENESKWDQYKNNKQFYINKFIQKLQNQYGKKYSFPPQSKLFEDVLEEFKEWIEKDIDVTYDRLDRYYEKIKVARTLGEKQKEMNHIIEMTKHKSLAMTEFQNTITIINQKIQNSIDSILNEYAEKIKDKEFYVNTYKNQDDVLNEIYQKIEDKLFDENYSQLKKNYITKSFEDSKDKIEKDLDMLYQKARINHRTVVIESCAYKEVGHNRHIIIYKREVYKYPDGEVEEQPWVALRREKIGFWQRNSYSYPPSNFDIKTFDANKLATNQQK